MYKFVFALALSAAATGCAKQQFATQSPVPVAAVEVADLVELDAIAANRYVEAGAVQELTVRLQVTADEQTGTPRPRANVAMVIDTSASMKGEAIEQARAAALAMLDGLETGDRVSVVAFHSKAEVLVPSTEISEASVPGIRDAIGQMQATGTTAMHEGLVAGMEQLEYASGQPLSRLVLLSDGIPNDETQILPLGQDLANNGITVTALGLGVEYHEAMLADLAGTTGGRFHFIEETDKVATMFRDEVLHMDRLVAVQSSLALTAGPGVMIEEVVGWPSAGQGQTSAVVPVGDIAEDEVKNVVVRLSVEARADGSTVELLDATLSYGDAVTQGGTLRRDTFLAVEATSDDQQRLAGADLDTQLVAAKAMAAATMLTVVDQARSGQLQLAQTDLEMAEKAARTLATKMADDELLSLADEMQQLRETLPTLAPPKPVARKDQRRSKGKRKAAMGDIPAEDISPEPQPAPRAFPDAAGAQSLKRAHSRAFNQLH